MFVSCYKALNFTVHHCQILGQLQLSCSVIIERMEFLCYAYIFSIILLLYAKYFSLTISILETNLKHGKQALEPLPFLFKAILDLRNLGCIIKMGQTDDPSKTTCKG